jgi:hypothetical protein
MPLSSDSIRAAQSRLAGSAERLTKALRTALQQSESVAIATRGSALDPVTVQQYMTRLQELQSILSNVMKEEQQTANDITHHLKP